MHWRLLPPRLVQAQIKALEPVKIGYSGIGIAHDFLKIMEKNRIFEKYGLNAQNIYIGSGSLMNQAIRRRQYSIHHFRPAVANPSGAGRRRFQNYQCDHQPARWRDHGA